MQIECDSDAPITLNIDHPTPSPTPPRTPSSSSVFKFPKPHVGRGQISDTWSSPAFLKRSRISGNHYIQYDPFRTDDDYEGSIRSKRTKFGRESGQWRFTERTPSPDKEAYAVSSIANEQTVVAMEDKVEVTTVRSPEREVYAVGSIANEQTVVAMEDKQVSTVRSPESLTSEPERSMEAVSIGEDLNSPVHVSNKSDEAITIADGVENSNNKASRAGSEISMEVGPIILNANIDMSEAGHAYTRGSESAIEGVVEYQDPLKETENMTDIDEQMALGPPGTRLAPYSQDTFNMSKAPAVGFRGFAPAEEEETAPALQSLSPESTIFTESSKATSRRGISLEPVESGSQYGFGMDEEPGTSGSESLEYSGEELEVSFLSDWSGSEAEDGRRINPRIYQNSSAESLPHDESPDEDEESPIEASHFGLDGSAFSGDRSSHDPVSPGHAPIETINILSDSEIEDEYDLEESPSVHEKIQDAKSVVMEDVKADGSGDMAQTNCLEAKGLEKYQEPITRCKSAEEDTETIFHEDISAISFDNLETSVMKKGPYEDDGAGRVEDEPSNADGAEDFADHQFSSDIKSFPALSPDGLVAKVQDIDDDKTQGKADEEMSEESTVIELQDEVTDTSSSLLPKVSSVEIIDLESEGEEDVQLEGAELEIQTALTLRETKLSVVWETDQSASFMEEEDNKDNEDGEDGKEGIEVEDGADKEDREDGIDETVQRQVDDLPRSNESGINDLDIMGVLPNPAAGNRLSPAASPAAGHKVDDKHVDVDTIRETPNIEDEALNHSDDEFPDILDLFEAIRKSMIENKNAAVTDQPYHETGSHTKGRDENVQSTKDAPDEIDNDAKQITLETRPLSDSKVQTQLPTPNATQQTQLVSQESPLSLQPLQEDHEHLAQRYPETVNDVTSVVGPATPKRRSVVERLQELRRLSATLPRNRKRTDAASPWFAPKRSSEIIPNTDSDSVESEHSTSQISSDEGDYLKDTQSLSPIPHILRQSPRLHKTLPYTPSPSATDSTQQSGFRTTHSYFASLSTLSSHFSYTIDVFATIVSSTSISRAKSGPKDFYQSLYIADPSSASETPPITTARVFRPRKTAFPLVAEGDAILLRNFQVQTQAKRILLLSTDTSAWAVFQKGEDVQMNGPPVEFAAEERGYAKGLWSWWASLGASKIQKLEAAVPKKKPEAKKTDKTTVTPSPQKPARATIRQELRDGTTYTDDGVDDSQEDENAAKASKENTPRKTRAAVRHELQDGTTYTDDGVDNSEENNDSAKASKRTTPRKTRAMVRHELRDGTSYTENGIDDSQEDETGSAKGSSNRTTPRKTRAVVRHELRDGTTYTDGDKKVDKWAVHELRGGVRYRDHGD